MSFKSAFQAVGLWSLLVLPALAIVHENLAAVPDGWTYHSSPPESSTIVLQIGLQEQNLDQLESMIYAAATPGHTSYGNFMEGDDVAALLAPSSAASPAVMAWLKEAGVTNVHTDGAWINFATTVGTANKLLDTEFNYYENNGLTKLRTTTYSIPKALTEHIDLITPTTFFGKTTAQIPMPSEIYDKKPIVERQLNASCASLITPQCLKELYNIHYTPDSKSGSEIGFGSFLNQSARTEDLSLFEAAQGIPQQGFSVQLINGGVNDQAIDDNHGEANLDVEYIIGVSNPLPVISYITGGSP